MSEKELLEKIEQLEKRVAELVKNVSYIQEDIYEFVEDDAEDTDTENAEKQYTKSDITHMSTADLKTLAPTLGIEVTEESTGTKLKEEIIAKLGL